MLSISSVSSASVSDTEAVQEPLLRTAVILGIVRFTSWPHHALNKDVINICTIGQPAVEPSMKLVSHARKVVNKIVVVHVVQNHDNNIVSCDVLVVGPDLAPADFASISQRAASLPILTICDGCSMIKPELIVRLIVRNNRIGFEIDLGSAKKQGIKFRSSLLELASEVKL